MRVGRNRRHFFLNCPLNAGPVQQVFEWGKVGGEGGGGLKGKRIKWANYGGAGGNPGACLPG